MVEMTQKFGNFRNNPAFIFLGEPLTGYFKDKTCGDLICTSANPE